LFELIKSSLAAGFKKKIKNAYEHILFCFLRSLSFSKTSVKVKFSVFPVQLPYYKPKAQGVNRQIKEAGGLMVFVGRRESVCLGL